MMMVMVLAVALMVRRARGQDGATLPGPARLIMGQKALPIPSLAGWVQSIEPGQGLTRQWG